MAAFSQPITSHQLKRRGKNGTGSSNEPLSERISNPWQLTYLQYILGHIATKRAPLIVISCWPGEPWSQSKLSMNAHDFVSCMQCLKDIQSGHSSGEKKKSFQANKSNAIEFCSYKFCCALLYIHICIVYSVEKLNGSSRPGGQSSRTLTKLAPSAQKDKQTKWTNRQTEWQMDRVG